MGSFDAFKPFAKQLINSSFYKYYFKIYAPDGIGMEEPVEFDTQFHLPTLPSPAPKEMQFLTSKKFVTGSSNLSSLEVQSCDYQ
jgi:hypothetical protein